MMRSALLLLLFFSSPLLAESLPLTLQEAFEAARQHNESFQSKEQEIRAAEGRYWQALGGTLPQLSATGTEFIQDTAGSNVGGDAIGSTFLRRSSPEVAIRLKQPLFQGLREFRALSASSADRRKSELDWGRSRQLLFLDVAQVFLSIKELEKETELLESQLALLGERVRELKGRVGLGKSRPSEVLTTESQQAVLEAERARRAGDLTVARETLSFLTGLASDRPLTEPEPAVPELSGLTAYLPKQESRPDVLATHEALTLSRAKLGYEKGGYFPKLNLEANYYPYRVGFRDPIDWDLLFTLEVPLFDGGTTRGLVKEARARLKQAEFAKTESERRAELEIEEAYHTLVASRIELTSLQSAEEKSAKNYQMQLKEYRLGLVNNLEVLQARRDWHEVARALNQATHRALLGAYRFQLAIGEAPL